jgi:deoxyribodipyrimidine photolyase-like uncharacterized protein
MASGRYPAKTHWGLGILLVENPWKAARHPYHKQKLALMPANLRHFGLEQAHRGVAVRSVAASGPYHEALEPLLQELCHMCDNKLEAGKLTFDAENGRRSRGNPPPWKRPGHNPNPAALARGS